MSAKSEKSFRTAIGGFNRQDVLDYISASAREHKNEIEAYRVGADKLRNERDALNAQVVELINQKERADRLDRELLELKRERDELVLKNNEHERRASELAAEVSMLSLKVQAFEDDEQELGEARVRAEELEMQAYRRAEEIEAEAALGADKLQSGAKTALSELKDKLESIQSDAEKAAYSIVLELDKMRSWYAHYGDAFEEITDKLRDLDGSGPPVVREFVPQEFSE